MSLGCKFFCEISWTIWIIAERNRRVVGKSLEWNDAEKGREGFARLGNIEDLLVRAAEFTEEFSRFHVFAV